MKRDEGNIEEVLERSLPSVSKEQIESARERIFNYVQSDAVVDRNADDNANFQPDRRFGWGRLAAMAAVVALVVVAIWIGMGWQARRVYARLETEDGSMSRLFEGVAMPIRAGEPIETQEIVRSGGGGSTFVLADGSRVEMRAQSELTLERADDGVRIRLIKGDIIVNAAKQHGHLYVRTKEVTVSVVGTVFLVKSEESGTRVAVIEGEVHVQQGATDKKLHPGEQVKTNALMESQPVSQEIAWSKSAAAHIALLQQSAASPVAKNPLATRVVFEEVSIRPSGSSALAAGARGGGPGVNGCGGGPPQIDPGRFAISKTTLYNLIVSAYGSWTRAMGGCLGVSAASLISGGPEWVRSDQWDIQAIIPEGLPAETLQQFLIGDASKLQMMIQNLLADRFKLVLRRETKEMPVYLLTAEKGPPRITLTKNGPVMVFGAESGMMQTRVTDENQKSYKTLRAWKESMADLASFLSTKGKPVLDGTGLTGGFDFYVEYDENGLARPTLGTALEEQVGLKLVDTKAPLDVWVIEHVEKLSEN